MSTLHGNHLGNDYVARQYDPALGRFLQADAIIPDPANPQSLNRYSYTLGNPLKYIDPSGHFPIPLLALAIMGGLAYHSHHYEGLSYWALVVASPAITQYPDGTRVTPPTSSEAVTSWLIEQMKINSQGEATALIRENYHGGPAEIAGALAGWNALVRTGAVWDFKRDFLNAGIETVSLGGMEYSFQAVANPHYGFVGRAAGIGADLLRIGAGAAQLRYLQKNPAAVGPIAYRNNAGRWHLTFYDQPFDAWWVLFGMFLYEQYGSDLDSLTETTFTQALEQFSEDYGACPPLD